MKRTSQEIIKSLEDLVSDKEDERYISILEDVADSVTEDTSRAEADEWKAKYEESERSWKEKYRARFMEGTPDPEPSPETEIEVEVKTSFDDLFTSE